MYEIVFKESARKELSKVHSVYYETIEKHICELAHNPRPSGCKKLVTSANTYRIRIGVYRVIYTIKDNQLIVEIIKIGHRSNIYM